MKKLDLPAELKTYEDAKNFNLALREQGVSPMEYCKYILKYTYDQLIGMGYRIDTIRFFFNRQCDIYMKNKTMISLSCEMCTEQIALPDLDEIEYVRFYNCVPIVEDDLRSDIFSYGIGDAAFEEEFEFDSVGGVHRSFSYDGVFDDGFVKHMSIDEKQYRKLWRECDDVSNCYLDHEKYWRQNYTDALAGAFVAEGVLLSSDRATALGYGKNDYISKVAKLPTPPKKLPRITNKNFYERCKKLCSYIKLGEADNIFAAFVYTYLHSLLWGSHCENFSMIKRVFVGYLENNGNEAYLDIYSDLLDFDYYGREIMIGTDHISQLKTAIGVLAKTNSYTEALEMLLSLTGGAHRYHLVFCLLGAFAGAYYQHYRIPAGLLKSCPYFDRFMDKILPFDDPSYNKTEEVI